MIQGDSILNKGQWYNVIWVKNSSDHKIFLNGVEESLTRVIGSIDEDMYFDDLISGGTVGYTIGEFRRDSSTNQFEGFMDDVVIYDRALSQSETQEIYNGGLVGKPICTP